MIGHSGPVIFVTWSHDDTRVLSSSVTHRIKLWNVQTEQCLRTFTRHTGDPVTLAFLPCGTKFVSGGVDKLVLLWDLESCDVCSQWIGDAVRIFEREYDSLMFFSREKIKYVTRKQHRYTI